MTSILDFYFQVRAAVQRSTTLSLYSKTQQCNRCSTCAVYAPPDMAVRVRSPNPFGSLGCNFSVMQQAQTQTAAPVASVGMCNRIAVLTLHALTWELLLHQLYPAKLSSGLLGD